MLTVLPGLECILRLAHAADGEFIPNKKNHNQLGIRGGISIRIYYTALLLILLSNTLIPITLAASENEYMFSIKWSHTAPYFIDVDENGNIYVAERMSSVILKYNSEGVRQQWDGTLPPELGTLGDPEGISAGRPGYLYVTDAKNLRVLVFDTAGVFKNSFGSSASNAREFEPFGIAIEGNGNVYVTDKLNQIIQKFDKDGKYLTQWDCLGDSIAVDNSEIVYVADEVNNRIQKFNSNGVLLGLLNGDFIDPEDVAVDILDNVYVVDSDNNRIQKFDSQGNWLSNIGSTGGLYGQLSDPRGVAIDHSGSIYVADTVNKRIQKFVPKMGERRRTDHYYQKPIGPYTICRCTVNNRSNGPARVNRENRIQRQYNFQ